MKIGILTFHNAYNYGAVLQAYALQEVLIGLGNEVEIIDYRNSKIDRFHNYWSLKCNSFVKVLYRLLFSYAPLKKKERYFHDFLTNYLHLSNVRYDQNCTPSGYDLYIIGSDQVWNPLITGGIDPYYWGAFFKDGKTISYAASSSDMNNLLPEELEKIKCYLLNFSSISVRENRLKDFLYSKFLVLSQVVLDPTLLAGGNCFEKICVDRIIHEPYILVYQVGVSNSNLWRVVQFVAKHYHAKIVMIGGVHSFFQKKYKGFNFIDPDIPSFLSLFKYAECVVPISFHGVAFSLLFEKDFYYLKGYNMERIYSILNPLNLQDRIVNSIDTLFFERINYQKINLLLDTMRDKSLSFLHDQMKLIKK